MTDLMGLLHELREAAFGRCKFAGSCVGEKLFDELDFALNARMFVIYVTSLDPHAPSKSLISLSCA